MSARQLFALADRTHHILPATLPDDSPALRRVPFRDVAYSSGEFQLTQQSHYANLLHSDLVDAEPFEEWSGVALLKVVLAAFALAVAMAAPVAGGDTDVPAGAEVDHLDIDAYRSLYGVSIEAARREISEADRIGQLNALLERMFPGAFAGLWIDHDPYRVTVATTTLPDDGMQQAVGQADLSVDVEYQRVAWSLVDLQDTVERTRVEGVPADRSIDLRGNRVEVRTLSRADLVQALPSDLRSSAVLVVREVASLATPTVSVYGGLGGSFNNWMGCPSTFTVRKVGTTIDGVFTAGHCSNSPYSYQGVNLPFQAEKWGGSADAQWHTVPGFTAPPIFYSTPTGSLRNVLGEGHWTSIVPGQTLCKNGPAGGYRCGTVETRFLAPSYVPSATATWVRVKNCSHDMALDGDSGGPVFYGNTAWGIISGREHDLSCSLRNMLIFGSQDFAYQYLPVYIKTY